MFHANVLALDPAAETERIAQFMKNQIYTVLRRSGIIVSVSGGIDSSVSAALSVRAVGAENVICLSLPEHESSPESTELAQVLAEFLKVRLITREIGSILKAFGCYSERNEAVKRVFPEFNDSYKLKLSLSGEVMGGKSLNFYNLVIEAPDGSRQSKRLDKRELLEIIAATNHKQRTRKQIEYYYADRFGYAVVGTPNRLEYDQGFFVKGGDGLADIKPIAHLYKTQVYELGKYLGLPEIILKQKPTTDTYSMEQSQEEFFFSLPYHQLDLVMWALNHDVPASEVADVMHMPEDKVVNAYKNVIQKRRTTKYLHMRPLLVDAVPEITK